MQPFDLTEWAQGLRIASDTRIAEFAFEVLEMVDGRERLDWLESEIVDPLEKLAGDGAEFIGEPEKALQWIEGRLAQDDKRREKLLERAQRVVDFLPAPLEYDL